MQVRELPSALAVVAAEELHEDTTTRDEAISHMKEWLSKQLHISCRADDQWLLAFLRSCKYNLDRAKEKIDNFYTLRTAMPKIFRNRDPLSSELQKIFDLELCFPLPRTDRQGRRVIVLRPGKFPPSVPVLNQFIKLIFMTKEILLLEDDSFTIQGMVVLLDLGDVSLGHMTLMSPAMIKKVVAVFQDGYPIRLKGVNYINTPAYCYVVLNIVRVFLKEKLRKRLYIHGKDMESLYEKLPKDVLPKEYGGTEGCVSEIADEWRRKVESYREWFLENEKYGVDKKKRPGKVRSYEEIFEVEGGLRTVSVD